MGWDPTPPAALSLSLEIPLDQMLIQVLDGLLTRV